MIDPVRWHTFLHSYATTLESHGEDVKIPAGTPTHANSSEMLNLYARRLAPSKVAQLVFQAEKTPSR